MTAARYGAQDGDADQRNPRNGLFGAGALFTTQDVGQHNQDGKANQY